MSDQPAADPAPLPPTVRRMGWLHFWNDLTLDFVSPLLPSGVGPAWLGVMEGAADAVGQVLKLFTGRASDRRGLRVPWVRAGYATNAAARPLIGIGLLLAWPWWIVACRVADRVGKGLRGSSSDALVADWTADGGRARAFARMRAMDHLGAAAGGVLAALAAWLLPGHLGWCVLALALPMLVQFALVAGLRDHPDAAPRAGAAPPGWLPADPRVRRLVIVLALAGMARVSPLLLLAAVVGVPGTAGGWPLWQVCAAWALLGLAQSGLAELVGRIAERRGERATVVAGWLLLAGAYALAAVGAGWPAVAAALGAAVLSGAGEGAEKSLVAEQVAKQERATAFGLFTLVGAGAGLAGNAGFGLALAWLPGSPWPFAALAAAAVLGAVAVWSSSRR